MVRVYEAGQDDDLWVLRGHSEPLIVRARAWNPSVCDGFIIRPAYAECGFGVLAYQFDPTRLHLDMTVDRGCRSDKTTEIV
jgi:hypothetical protein